ncbi:unnamed protein product [Adineta steineri]|uniref:Uncharacterized protein n=1 Tax=Adineta steineri TaxID=433720 RepID=A0A814MVA7_9BILA|nr:unnamed protein product [Adineta steineri]
MKKGTKGEVVLSPCQIQATRLNRLEHRRLQNRISLLRNDLKIDLARLHREEQGLIYHFTHVVKVVKPNPQYQLWKQEYAPDGRKHLIESVERKQKHNSITYQLPPSLSDEISLESLRPLLLLADNGRRKSVDYIFDENQYIPRPTTSPVKNRSNTSHRMNSLSYLLDNYSNNIIQQPPFYSLPTMKATNSRKLISNKLLKQEKPSNVNLLYRIT